MSPDKIALAYSILLIIQCLHSLEELSTGFHRKWYLFSMPFSVFLTFEIAFLLFWMFVWLTPTLSYRESLMAFFNLLMFANGVQHVAVELAVDPRFGLAEVF